MKGGFVAAVAAMAGVASAGVHNHRHPHDLFKKRGEDLASTCSETCKTITTVIVGEPTLVQPTHQPTPYTNSTTSQTPTSTPVPVTTTSTEVIAVVPTPEAHTCPTPGTYTFTATTITVDKTTTVCGATSTSVPSGTHTVGGVTTVVETATTVTCPVATVQTSGTVTTSTIVETEYVCPSAGTYTIAPTTTTATEDCTITYVVPTTYCPGTYTKPEEVVTITETDYTTYCPFESVGPTTTAAPTTSQAPPPPPPAPTTTTEAEAAPTTESKSSGSTAGGLVGDNDHYGITYTPYTGDTGDCKSASEVESDLAQIKREGFSVVRVYSTDCNTLENVGSAAKKHGIQLILGVFVKGSGCSYSTSDIKDQVDAIANWAQWDMVKLLVVGNEAIMNGYCSASELRDLVNDVKSKCSGYNGPYTISETLNIWQQSGVPAALCPVIDYAGANIHAFFNSETPAHKAGDFVKSQLDILDDMCEGKKAINLECGWPTGGECNGQACPGSSEQAEALKSIRQKTGDRTVFFSHNDDRWKAPGAFGCEQSWGVHNYFKELLDNLL